jgi:hypothetical protein
MRKMNRTATVLAGLALLVSARSYGLGVTELLQTTGESFMETGESLIASPEATTENFNSQQTTEESNQWSEGTKDSAETVYDTSETFGKTTKWLICADKCKEAIERVKPAAQAVVIGAPIAEVQAEQLNSVVNDIIAQNPQLTSEQVVSLIATSH